MCFVRGRSPQITPPAPQWVGTRQSGLGTQGGQSQGAPILFHVRFEVEKRTEMETWRRREGKSPKGSVCSLHPSAKINKSKCQAEERRLQTRRRLSERRKNTFRARGAGPFSLDVVVVTPRLGRGLFGQVEGCASFPPP